LSVKYVSKNRQEHKCTKLPIAEIQQVLSDCQKECSAGMYHTLKTGYLVS